MASPQHGRVITRCVSFPLSLLSIAARSSPEGGEQASPEDYGALVARVSALEAEVKEVKETLAHVLALISGDPTAQGLVTRPGDVVMGPCLLLELPVELLQKIMHHLDGTALYYASKTCVALYNITGCNLIWRDRFMSKWGAFYETFRNEHLQLERKSDSKQMEVEEGTYKRLYKETSLGRRSWNVQVYKRHLNEGFRASFTDAEVKLDPLSLTYVATYKNNGPLSVAIERDIVWSRIRSVPLEVWGIDPSSVWDGTPIEELKAGMEVEVQWAPAAGIAFCWWYGEIASIQDDPVQPNRKRVELKFYQYPEGSYWASGTVLYPNLDKEGDERGIYGGIRPIRRSQDYEFWKKRKELGDW